MKFSNALLQLTIFAPSCVSAFTTPGIHPSSTVSSKTSTTQLCMDYDTMCMAELTHLSHQMGYDTTGKNRVDLIMICKGRPELVNARPLSSASHPTPFKIKQSVRSRSRDEDYDMMTESQLKQIANEKGFCNYQMTRTDLLMVANGHGDRFGAKRLDQTTWRPEHDFENMARNNMQPSGALNLPPQQTRMAYSTSNPASNEMSNIPPSVVEKMATPSVVEQIATNDSVGIISEEVELPKESAIRQYYDFLTKLDSLHIPNINKLVAEYDTCNSEDKKKVKKAIMDLYKWEINMHSERLTDLHELIHHMTKDETEDWTGDQYNWY